MRVRVQGITWVPVAAFLFPIPIMLLVPLRQYVLPQARPVRAMVEPARLWFNSCMTCRRTSTQTQGSARAGAGADPVVTLKCHVKGGCDRFPTGHHVQDLGLRVRYASMHVLGRQPPQSAWGPTAWGKAVWVASIPERC